MRLGELLGNRKPQTRSLRFRRVEGREELRESLGSDTDSAVTHLEKDAPGFRVRTGRDADRPAAGRHRLDRVGQQTQRHLLQEHPIPAYRRKADRQGLDERRLRRCHPAGHHLNGFADDDVEIHRQVRPIRRSHELQQLFQPALQPVHLGHDAGKMFGGRDGRSALARPQPRHLRRRADIRQRIPDSVGDRRHHFADRRQALRFQELALHRRELLVGPCQFSPAVLQVSMLLVNPAGGAADDPEEREIQENATASAGARHGELRFPDAGKHLGRELVGLHHTDHPGRTGEHHGHVDLHQPRELVPLVPVLLLALVPLQTDHGLPGERLGEMRVVRKPLADQARLVRPDDSHAGVVELDPYDLGHRHALRVQRFEMLPGGVGVWLEKVIGG